MEKTSVILALNPIRCEYANLQLICVTLLKSSYREPVTEKVMVKQMPKRNTSEFDYQTLTKVNECILSAAMNQFKFNVCGIISNFSFNY